MAILANRERTETQWQELMRGAGLRINGIWKKDSDLESLIEVVLADE